MKKTKLLFILPVILLAGCFANQSVKQNVNKKVNQNVGQTKSNVNTQKCSGDECLGANNLEQPVDKAVEEALNEAIQDEYKALSTYYKTIEKFGNNLPFTTIIRAEEQHISSLKILFDKYGLEIPKNNWPAQIQAPESLSDACAVGVEAEIANAALYKDKLIPAVTDYPDIAKVFNNLMTASQDNHLPAFEKCK